MIYVPKPEPWRYSDVGRLVNRSAEETLYAFPDVNPAFGHESILSSLTIWGVFSMYTPVPLAVYVIGEKD